jgi:hypothetical protein
MPAIAIGSDVDSWCTRCKLMLAHTVEAMVESKITRVHCNTCGTQHAYRPHPPGEGPRARASRPVSTRQAASSTPPDYHALIAGRPLAGARRYAVSERYQAHELIRHSSFGVGVVLAEKEGNKVAVLFADGPRTLLHRR